MDEEVIFVRLAGGEDLLATTEGEDGLSVNIPEPILGRCNCTKHAHKITWVRANGRTGRTTEMIQLY